MEKFNAIYWIVIVNLTLYFKTLRFKFVSDDFSVYHSPPEYKNRFHKRWLQFTGQMKLISKTFNFYRDNGKWKFAIIQTAEQEHLLALMLHILICILIYIAFGKSQISFVAALLYATNPVNNQGTIWPGGRGYALPIACLLLAMAVPLTAPVALGFCSWYTIGFLAPLALIGSSKWYLVGWMPLIWLLHSRKWSTALKSKAKIESFDEDKVSLKPKKFVILIKTFGFYLTLCLFPHKITFYHSFLQSMSGSGKDKAQTIWDKYFWIGAIAICSFVFYIAQVQWSTLHWSLFAFFITIIPFCNFIRANQEIAERFCALPNVFLMLALSHLIASYSFLVAAFVIFYATRTFYTLIMYKDEYFITELAILEDPNAWYAWHVRAHKRWDTQSYKEALIMWVMARLISPREFKILMNISTCLRMLKNDKEADAFLRLAKECIVPGQEKQSLEFIEAHRKGKLPILL